MDFLLVSNQFSQSFNSLNTTNQEQKINDKVSPKYKNNDVIPTTNITKFIMKIGVYYNNKKTTRI